MAKPTLPTPRAAARTSQKVSDREAYADIAKLKSATNTPASAPTAADNKLQL